MIVGVGGAKRAGKGTIGEALHEVGFKELSFADPLKKACAFAFGEDYELFDDHAVKDKWLDSPLYLDRRAMARLISFLCKYQHITDTSIDGLMADGVGREFFTPRAALQFIGTDLVRKNVHPEFWVQIMLPLLKRYDNVVITDVRLPNERQAIKDLGGKLVLVKRPSLTDSNAHITENSLGEETEYDYVVTNDSTIDTLHDNILDWVETIGQETA